MTSRSRSPEKKKPSTLREQATFDGVRNGSEPAATTRRIEKVLPQTPPTQRFISSTYTSPGSILGREEDAIVIELDPRYLLAGIEGESHGQCRIKFCPEDAARVGDWRRWLSGYKHAKRAPEDWSRHYELWRNDIEELDMNLLGDKLERAMREAYNKYLLVDAGLARLVLVLPSLVPHPVLDTILSTLFERWGYPSITLLPVPTMVAFAAGLRSALVVDIGWEETVVTSLYEFREVSTRRSARGMKQLTQHLGLAVKTTLEAHADFASLRLDLAFVEDVLQRVASLIDFHSANGINESATESQVMDQSSRTSGSKEGIVDINWPSEQSTSRVSIPIHVFSTAIEKVLITGTDEHYADDDESSVPKLIFESLVALTADVRATCIGRIVFAGQFANLTNFKQRILDEVTGRIRTNGWSTVRGSKVRSDGHGPSSSGQTKSSAADAKHDIDTEVGKDYVEEKVRKLKAKKGQAIHVSADVREVLSLGAWSGGSLLTALKIRGMVEIERERYLSQGITGAGRDAEISVVPQPQRMSSFGIPKASKTQDRTSWTLSSWG